MHVDLANPILNQTLTSHMWDLAQNDLAERQRRITL